MSRMDTILVSSGKISHLNMFTTISQKGSEERDVIDSEERYSAILLDERKDIHEPSTYARFTQYHPKFCVIW
jgi:hypothetical protein